MDTLNVPEEATGRQESLRCPDCGGLNRAGSEWCGQCLRRFGAPSPPAPRPAPAAPSPTAPMSPPPAPVPQPRPDAPQPRPDAPQPRPDAPQPRPDAPGEGPGPIQRGAFKLEGDRMMWTCKLCGHDNDLEALSCAVCGAAFAQTVAPPQQRVTSRDPGTVTLISLFFPGAGHAYLGLWGQAVARGMTSLWVALMTLMLAVQRGPGSMGALVFSVVSFGLWLVSAHDAYREATFDRRSVLLKDRWFMYLVLGLLLLSFVMVFSAAMQARA